MARPAARPCLDRAWQHGLPVLGGKAVPLCTGGRVPLHGRASPSFRDIMSGFDCFLEGVPLVGVSRGPH